ncbi:MAG: T9SS type A sorting domain-containing protein, partial [Schleiferiaceae bacterium]
TSATVLETVHGNETWAGLFVDLNNKLDFTTDSMIDVMVWAPATGTMRLKLEDKANSSVFWEADQPITVASQWTKISWNLSGQSNLYDRVVLFPGWGATSGTFYLDNISQGTASGIGMDEEFANSVSVAPNPANDFVSIALNAEKGQFTVATLTGQTVASGLLNQGQNTVSTATLANGMYLVRVSSEAGSTVQKLMVRH